MDQVQKLPFDILFEISEHISNPKDRMAFAFANRELFETIQPRILKACLFDPIIRVSRAPIHHAIYECNIPFLSTIYEITKGTWRDLLKDCEGKQAQPGFASLLFYATEAKNSKSLEFLLSLVPPETCAIAPEHDAFTFKYESYSTIYRSGIHVSAGELLARAVTSQEGVDCALFLSSRKDLLQACDEDFLADIHMLVSSEAMSDVLLASNIQPNQTTLLRCCYTYGPYRGIIARLLELGLEIDSAQYDPADTPMIQLCSQLDVTGLQDFLARGANPNGIGPVTDKTRERIKLLSRPLDHLIESFSWQVYDFYDYEATKLRDCIKALVDHGASTAPARFAGDPIRTLLDSIWRKLCPMARFAAKVGKKKKYVTGDGTEKPVKLGKLLKALSNVDISPFDEICDIVVDASADYTARAPGLRGKERLLELLRQRGNKLRVWFRWAYLKDWQHLESKGLKYVGPKNEDSDDEDSEDLEDSED
ncbi:hypothetical protein F4779DRAFT_634746 [Xylariaceae sp. FL0662B]|nr:hypothetical protein F4779DRAFT_634746 [Xylariaceae sp. FL0662B]